MTQEEIDLILAKENYKQIIDADEFYFQKAQDVLNKWLQQEVSDSAKSKLIEFCHQYDLLKELQSKDDEIKNIMELLFEIISYCDVHANQKNIYNKYDDKRTLAKAAVRMGNWVAGLIKLKFKHEDINGASIINAFDYLIDPQNNTTVLSDNHRKLISHKLFNKEYEQTSFVIDLKNYYSHFNIEVKNNDNYSCLLSRLVYEISDEWNDERKKVNYWIFQGNPAVFDIEKALREQILNDWTVSAHKDKIKVGDKVILWVTGKYPGCYALAEVISEPNQKIISPDKNLWKSEEKNDFKVEIIITHNLVDNPILKTEIESSEEFKNLKVGYQGSNFTATEKEYQTLLEIISSNTKTGDYQSVKDVLDPAKLADFISCLRDYFEKNKLQPNDDRVSFNVRVSKKRLVFIIGSRYAFWIEKNKNITEVSFIYKEAITKKTGTFSNYKKEIEAYWNVIDDSTDYKEIIHEGFDIELNRNNKSPFRKYTNRDFIDDVFQSKLVMSKNCKNNSIPLNQILFGPPGTGKTYTTIEKAIQICGIDTSNLSRVEMLKHYNHFIENEQIVFTTFHQSLSYEDFVEGIKPEMKGDSPELSYCIEDGIFKQICEKAKTINISSSKENELNTIDWSNRKFFKMSIGGRENQIAHTWFLNENKIGLAWGGNVDLSKFIGLKSWKEHNELYVKLFPKLAEDAPFNISASHRFLNLNEGDIVIANIGNKVDSIGVVEGGYTYDPENSFGFHHLRDVDWIVKDLNAPSSRFFRKNLSPQSIYQLNSADIKLEEFKSFSGTNSKVKNHVLIIDEINRGNVSAILGELITLLEEDKRAGAPEAISLVLPYSKTTFSVPSNVYIIGTMNTADRSVEALDTALRRRFSFIEMPPNYSIPQIDNDIDGVNLKSLLLIMNARIEKLLNKDHQIGHAYFIGVDSIQDLKRVFKDKIIPLLQEYFYGDYGKIGLVLGKSFIHADSDSGNSFVGFAKYDYEDSSVVSDLNERKVYSITPDESWDFLSIIQ
jgi:hypothetical protein